MKKLDTIPEDQKQAYLQGYMDALAEVYTLTKGVEIVAGMRKIPNNK